ncbi:hydrogen gas-evolving membrane-bound hydrogenase subunit E [Verrucomicrobiota bacterium sgz303538]
MMNPPPAHFYLLLAALFLPVVFIPLVLASARRLKRLTGYVAAVPPLLSSGILGWLALQYGPQPDVVLAREWIPQLMVNFSLVFDGLSLFYGFVICGIGVFVCWYAAQYLDNEYRSHGRFYTYLLLFMTAMLGTVFSNNVLLLFVFWEITGVASFLLIGFFHEDEKSRTGARQALLVTEATGLCMLIGIIMLGLTAGSYDLHKIAAGDVLKNQPAAWSTAMCALLLVGAFGKSAQFPFQFWLPGAMAAPTPVSAYLHSATMVKLGVFLTARIFPIFSGLDLWIWLLGTAGFFTMLVGAYLALRSVDLKAILAYSTVSQLGFLMGAYGIGSRLGVRFDFVHILSHVFYKATLFMVAGIVDHATGIRDVRKLGGLARYMPLTAISAAGGAAALAGLPLTTGFISKEILLTDLGKLLSSQWGLSVLYLLLFALAATFSVTFAARIFFNVFLGAKPATLPVHPPGMALQIPPFLLTLCTFGFGIFPGGLDGMLAWLAVAGLHTGKAEHLALWHGFNFALFTSLGITAAGALLYWWTRNSSKESSPLSRALQFDVLFEKGLHGLSTFSQRLTRTLYADWPPMYLPIIVTFLLIVMAGAVVSSPADFLNGLKALDWSMAPDRAVVAALIICALFGVIILPRWTAQLVSLSGAGFLLTFYFVLYRAPDLAMTQILVESASVVLMLLVLSRFPSFRLESRPSRRSNHVLQIALSAGIGMVMFLLVIFADRHRHTEPVGPQIVDLSLPLAGGSNVVNTILVDFRGFDTMGEITVLLIATLGALGLMMRYKSKHKGSEPPPPGFLLGKEREQR